MSVKVWTRRGLSAALAPGLLSACLSPQRRLISINLADMGPQEPPPVPQQGGPPDAAAQLETAFDQARRMSVPVLLNGKGPFGFVVDTGANRTVVSTEAAAACNLEGAGRADVHGIAGAEPADLARVRRLAVGSVVSKDLVLPTLPRERLGADGLLGIDIMVGRQMSLEFDLNRF